MMRRTLRTRVACALVAVPFAVLASPAAAHDRYTRVVARPVDRRRVRARRRGQAAVQRLARSRAAGRGLRPRPAVRRTPRRSTTTSTCAASDASRHDAVWRPVWGEYRTIRNRYSELTIDLREESPRGARCSSSSASSTTASRSATCCRDSARSTSSRSPRRTPSSTSPTTSPRGGSRPSSAPGAATRSSGAARR